MEKELLNSEEANIKTAENIKTLNDIKFINYQSTLANIKEEIKKEINQAIEQCEYSCWFYAGINKLEYNCKMFDWDEKDVNNLIKELKEYLEQLNYKCEIKKTGYNGPLIEISINWGK